MVALVAACIVAVLLLGDVVLRAGWGQTLLLAPWVLFGIWAVYVGFVATGVTIDGTGVLVQNVVRRTRVPWGRVVRIDLRWQLELELDDGAKVAALGVAAWERPRFLGPSRRSAAEDALEVVHDRWQTAIRLGASGGPVERSWDRPALLALVILIAWAVAASALANAVG